jgi:MFS transporter, ACS family, hexuronate transporter
MDPSDVSRRRRWALCLAATFTMTISYVDRQTLSVLAPWVTAELGIRERDFGVLLSAFSIAYLVGAPLAGAWIDRVGARRGLLMSVLVWTVVAALHSLAPGFGVLLAMRVLLGFAESPSFPGAARTVQQALPPGDRARGIGVLFTGSSFGAMVAPPLAAAFMAAFSWRAAFLGTALVGLVWVPLWLALAWSPAGRSLLDAPPRAKTVAPPNSEDVDAAPFRGVAPLGADDPPLWRHPAMLRAVVLIVASAPALAFTLLWASKYLVTTFHVSVGAVAGYLWIPPLVYDVGAVVFGDLSSRRARRRGFDGSPDRALVAVGAVMCASVALLAVASSPPVAVAVLSLAMAGGAGLYALLTTDLFSRVPEASISAAGGLCAAAQSIAYVIANPLIGASAQATHGYRGAVCALGLWLLPGAVAWIVWKPPPARRMAT